WVEEPLRRLVDDARALLALVLHPSGQVLAQHGFTRAVDVMSACALAAAIHASSSELGRQLEGQPFAGLHHAGRQRQIFLAQASTSRGAYLCLTVFDQASSLGLVRLYFDEFRIALASAASGSSSAGTPVDEAIALADNFETDLNRNLAALFGRTG
ncbi:MAG: hypothetical protein ACRENI_13690, partial [Gemmatimonadaceae bacterium]